MGMGRSRLVAADALSLSVVPEFVQISRTSIDVGQLLRGAPAGLHELDSAMGHPPGHPGAGTSWYGHRSALRGQVDA